MSKPTAHLEVFESVWPDESFAKFGGHVLEQMFNVHGRLVRSTHNFSLPPKDQPRFKVTVRIEVEQITDDVVLPGLPSTL